MNFIEQQKYLRILKKNAPDVHFTRTFRGQFIAAAGVGGMKFTLPPHCSDKLVAEKAKRVEEELRAVWKDREVWGSRIDANKHEIVPRKN